MFGQVITDFDREIQVFVLTAVRVSWLNFDLWSPPEYSNLKNYPILHGPGIHQSIMPP